MLTAVSRSLSHGYRLIVFFLHCIYIFFSVLQRGITACVCESTCSHASIRGESSTAFNGYAPNYRPCQAITTAHKHSHIALWTPGHTPVTGYSPDGSQRSTSNCAPHTPPLTHTRTHADSLLPRLFHPFSQEKYSHF